MERRRDVDSSLRCALCRSRVYLSVFYVHRWRSACSNTDASDSKRVQVLQVQEVSATNESSVKKSKTAATLAKKKVAQRRTTRQTKAAANEGANTPLQSAMAVVVPATPAQNDTLALSAEQTGTLAVGDRAVALASSPGEDNNVGLSLANYVGTREDPSSAIAVGNPPRAISDTEQTPRHSDGRTEGAVKQELPSVTSAGDAERSNASGGVRLASGQLKPEAHFVRRRHVVCISYKQKGR
jgi:hypothetical protein